MAVLKVLVLAAVLCVAAAHAADVEVDVEADADARPRKGKKLVSPRVLKGKALMPKKHIIIVPKGDPRARAPFSAALPAQSPVLKAGTYVTSAACAAKPGRCIETAQCTQLKGSLFRGVCPGASVCCINIPAAPATPTAPTAPSTPAVPSDQCPYYSTLPTTRKAGNGNVMYDTVPIKQEHMSEPDKFGLSDTLADNTMRLNPTACAFARLQAAAAAAGVRLTIASGFRSLARQQYFWNCFQTKKCNNGNRAAVPGNSNHGVGLALDLNTDCGKQAGSRAPAACKSSKVYMYLLNNYRTHGFVRAVQDEPWHWEYRPQNPMPSWAQF